jgi:hypothetical protein
MYRTSQSIGVLRISFFWYQPRWCHQERGAVPHIFQDWRYFDGSMYCCSESGKLLKVPPECNGFLPCETSLISKFRSDIVAKANPRTGFALSPRSNFALK